MGMLLCLLRLSSSWEQWLLSPPELLSQAAKQQLERWPVVSHGPGQRD